MGKSEFSCMGGKLAQELLSSNLITEKPHELYAEVKEKIRVFQWE